MSGLISTLMNSAGALSVHSKGLDIAGKNLANINNRGYSKERVAIGDNGSINTGVATESMGVEVMAIQQNRDVLLDKSVMREKTATAALEAAKKILDGAQTSFGQFLDRTTDSSAITSASSATAGGVSDALSDFFNSWESYSVSPNDIGVKQLLIQKAEILAEEINTTDQQLGYVQSDVNAQINSDVIAVNDILKNIAALNGYIAKAEIGKPNSAVDLRDQRQTELENLSEYFDVSFANIPNGNGQIVVTANDVTGNPVTLVNGVDIPDNATVVFTGVQFEFGANVMDFSKGSLGSQLDTRDGAVQQARDEMANLAGQLMTSVNGLYGATGADFFETPPDTGSLINIDPSITVATLKATITANAGANELALAIADLANKVFASSPAGTDAIDGTFSAYFNTTVSELGQTLNTTNIRLEDQKLSEENAVATRDAYSGVSQDEELTDLMKFQRSFQASARVINVVDTLLDQVVNRLGAN